jgi:hypothetical protein
LAEAAHAFLELSGFKASLTSAELSAFRECVRAELVPNLADVRRTWQSNRSSDQHADEHMKPLLESFSALKEEFVDDPAILGTLITRSNSHGNGLPKWTMSPKRIGQPVFDDIDE